MAMPFLTFIIRSKKQSPAMTESPPKKKSRQPRTTSLQHEVFIAFAEANPGVLDNCDCHWERLWEDLVVQLNQKGPPIRQKNAWRENLKNWEYQIKFKKRTEEASVMATGGGPAHKQLSRMEERACVVFGRCAVVGDENVKPLGFEAEVVSSDSTRDEREAATSSKQATKKNKSESSLEVLSKTLSTVMDNKKESDAKKEKHLKDMADGLSQIGSALMMLAEAYKKSTT